jgi:hypothetical protein
MPYITQTARQIIDDGGIIQTAGELNYTFTQALKRFDPNKKLFLRSGLTEALNLSIERYMSTSGLSYRVINDVLGALEGAKLEFKRRKGPGLNHVLNAIDEVKADFYRRVAAPYEDEKIKQNGDVYGTDSNEL